MNVSRPLWSTTAVAGVCQLLGIGLIGVFGFFVAPVSQEFGVGVAVINIGPVFLLLAPALIGPIAGRMADVHSIRSLMLVGVLVAISALLCMAAAGSLRWLALAFLGYALGQSLYGPLILSTLLVKTYQARAARALGIAAMGTSAGAVLLPYIVAWLLDLHDWRQTLLLLACGMGLILLFTIRLGLPKFPPEHDQPVTDNASTAAENGFLRQPVFWIIGAVAAIVGNIVLVAVVSYAPHFANLGFDNKDIATFLAAAGFAGFTSKVFVAGFVDRLRGHLKWIALLVMLLLIAALLALMLGQSYLWSITGTCLLGAAGGGFIPFHPYLNSAYFPLRVIGRVNGAQAPLMLPLGLVGMPLAGYVFDVTGAYTLVFGACIVLAVAAAALLMLLPTLTPGTSLAEGKEGQQSAGGAD